MYSVNEQPNLFSWFQGVHRGGRRSSLFWGIAQLRYR